MFPVQGVQVSNLSAHVVGTLIASTDYGSPILLLVKVHVDVALTPFTPFNNGADVGASLTVMFEDRHC
jgi:hypothetical protein